MDKSRILSAVLIAVVGLIIPAGLAAFLVISGWTSDQVSSLVGLFTSMVGTLVGAFLGVQVGAAGKQEAEGIARRALAALSPADAERALHS